jgi:hypothetical protein
LVVLGDAEERVSAADVIWDLLTTVAPIGAVLSLGGFGFGRWRGRTIAQRAGLIVAVVAVTFVVLAAAANTTDFGNLAPYLFVPGACLLAIASGLTCAFRVRNAVVGAFLAASIPFVFVAFLASI